MVLYKAIKYTILDYAINIFLGRLFNNINLRKDYKIALANLRVGMQLSKIIWNDIEYINCYIEQINENFYNNMHFVRLECTETTDKGLLSTRHGKYLIDIVIRSELDIEIYL